MVECAGLEIRYTVIPYRGFKSLSFRQKPVLLSLIEFQKINKIKGLIEFHCLILSSLVLGNLSYVDVCLDE